MNTTSAAERAVALRDLLAPPELWQPDGSLEVDCHDMEGFGRAEPVVRACAAVPGDARSVGPGDILVSLRADAPRRAWVVGPARGRPQIAATDWLVLRSAAIDPGYGRHLLVSNEFERAWRRLALTRRRRRQVAVLDVTLLLPSLTAQADAARVFDRADILRSRRAAILDRARLLTRILSVAPLGAAPGTEHAMAPLASLLSEPPSRGADVHLEARGRFPVIRAADLCDGEVSPRDARHVSHSDAALARSALADGDVLLGREAGRAALRVAIARPGDAVWFTHAKLWRLRVDPQRVVPEYLRGWLASPPGQHRVLQAWLAAGSRKTAQQRLATIDVPLPPMRDQQRYAERLDAAERLVGRMLASAERLDALLGTLRDFAFRGELKLS